MVETFIEAQGEEFWDRDDDPSLSVRRTKAGRRTLEARLRAVTSVCGLHSKHLQRQASMR